MSAEIRSASVKLKSSQQKEGAVSLKGKGVASSSGTKKRPEDASSKRVSASTGKTVTAVVKTGVKEKTTVGPSSQTTTKTTRVRQKKEYKLAGQRYDTPEEREPLRIFYESLSRQIPSSEMAEFWMMEHGLLSPERAKRAFERKQKKQKELRMGTPIKFSTVRAPKIERPESSQKSSLLKNGEVKSRKRALDYSSDDGDDDFIIKRKRGKM
ncbi:hypothetical protein H6P81_009139 [Aristolochia fimbriata]|uniref:Uncharacterized protein n=1 Tax=Aristolochia fimbriata TaxID=158543 RepID=A0AAV7EKC7_ARIFI|nr:hypothetical protein H6P81_009139 [Aristolochia fimbriata]